MKSLFILAISAVSFAANANPFANVTVNAPVCYGREYSDKHMADHANQTVKSLKLQFYKDEYSSDDSLLMNIDANIKTVTVDKESKEEYVTYKPYTTGMFCNMTDSKLSCGIECDGGSAEVTWDVSKKGSEITLTNKGFVMYGGCGEDVNEEDMIWLEPKKGGDDVFKLKVLPAEFCQK